MSGPFEPGQQVTVSSTARCCPTCRSALFEFREDEAGAGTVGLFRCLGHDGETLYARPYSVVTPVPPVSVTAPQTPPPCPDLTSDEMFAILRGLSEVQKDALLAYLLGRDHKLFVDSLRQFGSELLPERFRQTADELDRITGGAS